MRHIKKLFLFVVITGLLLISFDISVFAQSETEATSICIVGTADASDFPNVEIDFRALNLDNQSVSTIDRASVQIKEEGVLTQPNSITANAAGVGLNISFVIDKGNRTDLVLVKTVLERYVNRYMIDGMDNVSLYSGGTETQSSERTFGPEDSVNNFSVTVRNLSTDNYGYPTSGLLGLEEAISGMRTQNSSCTEPNMIVGIFGDDVISTRMDKNRLIEAAINSNTRIFIIHSTKSGSTSSELFKDIALATGGDYYPVNYSGTGEFSELDQTLFTEMVNSRLTFTANYRSRVGNSGQRNVELLLANGLAATENNKTSYTVNLSPPTVTMVNPINGAKIVRTATSFVDPDLIYDVDTQNIEWQVEWQDLYPRDIVSFRINLITSTGTETIGEITPNTSGSDTYQQEWDLRNIRQEGGNPFGIQIEAVDELGLEGISDVANVVVENIIPDGVVSKTTELIQKTAETQQYQIYILYGVIGLLILLVVIFRKRIGGAFASGGAVNVALEKVRKTIIGGGHGGRRKVIAKLSVFRPMQELKSIFTENVILGRDPKQSDITFFTPGAECSVSGKHAQIIRKADGWKIIGISSSQSPVFVDGEEVKLHTEYPIRTGSKIELGYEDMGSAFFEFIEVETSNRSVFDEDSFESKNTKTINDEDNEYRQTKIPVGHGLILNDQDLDQDQGQGELPELTNDPDEIFKRFRGD